MRKDLLKFYAITVLLSVFMLTTDLLASPQQSRRNATPQESMMIIAFFITIMSAAPFYFYKKQQRKFNLGKQFIANMSDQVIKQKILMSISGKEKAYLSSKKIYQAIAISMIVAMVSYFFQLQYVIFIFEFLEFLIIPLIFLHMVLGAKMILDLAQLNKSMENSDKSVSDYFAAEGLSGTFGILFGKSFAELESSFNFNIPRTTPIVCPSCGGNISETSPEKCQYCGNVLDLSNLNTQFIEEEDGSMTKVYQVYKQTNFKFDKNMTTEEKKKMIKNKDMNIDNFFD